MLPGWLIQVDESRTHIDTVLDVLGQRENVRTRARTLSQRATVNLNPYDNPAPDTPLTQYYAVTAGSRPDRRADNRYAACEPYDRTLVTFDPHAVLDSSSYINANWVRELYGGKWWIATQAPLPNTAHTFLNVLMQPLTPPYANMYENVGYTYDNSLPRNMRVRTIVQLTREVESGIRKAHSYFPTAIGETFTVTASGGESPPLLVTLVSQEEDETTNSVISTIAVYEEGSTAEPVVFNHLLYSAWPDHGVPVEEDRGGLIAFVHLVDNINRHPTRYSTEPDPPVMINCSAGIGRTGTFMVLSSLLRAHGILPSVPYHIPTFPMPPLGPLPEEIASDMVAQEIDACREQRIGAVQREDQILLLYHCLKRVLSDH